MLESFLFKSVFLHFQAPTSPSALALQQILYKCLLNLVSTFAAVLSLVGLSALGPTFSKTFPLTNPAEASLKSELLEHLFASQAYYFYPAP